MIHHLFFYFDHIACNFVYKWFTNQARSKMQYIASNLLEGMIKKHFFSFSRWKVMRFSIIETCTIYHICTFVYHQWSSHLVKIKLLLWTFKKMFRIDFLKLRFLSKKTYVSTSYLVIEYFRLYANPLLTTFFRSKWHSIAMMTFTNSIDIRISDV